MTDHANVFFDNEDSGKGYFSATKEIIEMYIYHRRTIEIIPENTTIRVHYTTETMSKITATRLTARRQVSTNHIRLFYLIL